MGFLRAMSPCSVRSRWLADGSTVSLKAIMPTATTLAASRTGMSRRLTLTPLALSAVISLSAAIRLKAYSTATSTDIGIVIASVNGTDRPKNSAMTLAGSPLPTRLPNCLEM